MHRKSHCLGPVAFVACSLTATAHDLVGIDGERERKLQALEAASGQPSAPAMTVPRTSVRAPAAAAVITSPTLKLDTVHINQLNVIVNRNQGIVVAKDLSRSPELLANVPGLTNPGQVLDSVISVVKTWDPGSSMKVCFYDGDSVARTYVRVYALEWTRHGNLTLDFGAPPSFRNCIAKDGSEIRITFAVGGAASYVGKDSLYFSRQNLPTMFLQNLDRVNLLEPRYKSIVIHEFGHALGFEHEHQSPMASCEGQFDFQRIKQELRWDDAKVKVNFEQIRVSKLTPSGQYFVGVQADGTPISLSNYDSKSVMHYSLPASYFKQPPGSCFVPINESLSDQDMKAMAATYPYVGAAAFNAKHNSDIDKLLKAPQLPEISKAALKALKRF